MNKEFHVWCLKPKELSKYGFVESSTRYEYETSSKGKKIVVWKNNARRRTANRMTFAYGTPTFSIELAYLFANLLKEGIIEFDVSTEEERKEKKIKELEEQIRKLKNETTN